MPINPIVPGRELDNDMAEICFKNGEAHMKEQILDYLQKQKSTAIGSARLMLGDIIEKVRNM